MERSQWHVGQAQAKLHVDQSHKQQATYDPNYLAPPAAATAQARTRRQVDQARQANKALELDWAGNAVYTKHRAAVPGAQAAGTNLTQSDEGVLPGSAAPVQAEFVGKKHYEDDIRFRSHASESRGAPMGSAAYQQGPGMPSAQQWTSTAKVMQTGKRDEVAAPPSSDRRLLQQSAAAASNNSLQGPGHGVRGAMTGRYPQAGTGAAAMTAQQTSRRAMQKGDFLSSIADSVADRVGDLPPHLRASGMDARNAAENAQARDAATLQSNYSHLPSGYTGRAGR